MKVVHLSLSNDGGAGIAAYRLHTALKKAGVDSTMLVLYSKNSDPDVKIINTTARPSLTTGPGISPHFYIYEQRQAHLTTAHSERQTGRAMFTDASSEVVLEAIQELQEADIVNLHWVSGVVDYARINHTFRDKQLVWTLHGMNDFTGGCSHADECTQYQSECRHCPQLGPHPFNYAGHFFHQKLFGIQPLNLIAVCPSRWLAQHAEKSTILSGKQIQHIPNGVATDIFKPMEAGEARRYFNIPQDHFVILFGAFDAANERKGFKLLVSAFQYLAPEECARITLVGFGASSETLLAALPCATKGIGTVCDEENLALIYSMADLFVMPSMAENLPNSILESLACGTPVVAFRIGGIPEIITHQSNGYLAEPFEPADLAEGIVWCMHNRPQVSPANCVQSVRDRFSVSDQAMQYTSLYQRHIANGSSCKHHDTKA